MELSQLRAILALSELGSISKAADYLHLSAPAVFAQIRQLEEQVGAKLYERVGRRLALTSQGKRLAACARQMLQVHDEALAALRGQNGTGVRVLRIGCGPHSSVCIMPHLLRAFLNVHPGTEIRLATGDDEFLLREARSGSLDAILISLPLGRTELEEHPLWAYEMVFAVPRTAARGKRRRPKLTDLREEPFIRYHRPVVVDAAIHKLSQEAGFKPKVVMEHDNPDSIRELVKLGIGYAALPSASWSSSASAMRLCRSGAWPRGRPGCFRTSAWRPPRKKIGRRRSASFGRP